MRLGEIRVREFLERAEGKVRGRVITDAKDRHYAADYRWRDDADGTLWLSVGDREAVKVPAVIELDEALVAFFGLYSGDGSKGTETPKHPGRIFPNLSFSQKEPNLIRFAVVQFRRIFPGAIRFTFSLGEDSAYFMAGDGLEELRRHYGGTVHEPLPLGYLRPELDDADRRYLDEVRPVAGSNEHHLAFYYQHKEAMEEILVTTKRAQLERGNIQPAEHDKVSASLRRPFKKGARQPGGSSRADETTVGGASGLGELFLKILHEIEESLLDDQQVSVSGLIVWDDQPSRVGAHVDIEDFFSNHAFGSIAGERPLFGAAVVPPCDPPRGFVAGRWQRSTVRFLRPSLRLTPLWCYTSGLYLAEGTTDKALLFAMYREAPRGFGIGFTSSENTSLALILRALASLFPAEHCVDAWKVKVGSQYFFELVVIGLKNAVPMLRGGASGDGKLRTMEISLAVREWALGVAPAMADYVHKYSHVEPTGAGVPRIDFWASSSLCKWYFPLVLYAVFGETVADPIAEFAQ